jgi:hypothetical protein
MKARRMLAGVALALASSPPGLAAAADLLPSLTGDVRVAGPGEPLRPMRDGERLGAGSTITTGEASRTILRFPDGQRVVLGPHTALRVVDYRYEPARAQADRSLFELLRGAARLVTGTIGRRSADAIALRTPHAMIQVRDGDFSVAVVNPTYVRVREGAIVASNSAGRMVYAQGVTGAIAGAGAPPAVVAASAVPVSAAAAFEYLGRITTAELALAPEAGGRAIAVAGSGDSAAVTHHSR